MPNRAISFFICVSFVLNLISPSLSFAEAPFVLPAPGTMVSVSQSFMPTLLRGVTVHPENPLALDFLVDKGDAKLDEAAFKSENEKAVKYFLAALTIPEKDLWVNLSPYEKNRIAPEKLSETELGRDLLAQDYILKQLTASLIYPENDLGRAFWNKVYAKAKELYGTTEIPINTFNKVWVVPDRAVVYEAGNTALLVDSHLKVMLEEDYLAVNKNLDNEQNGTNGFDEQKVKDLSRVSSPIVREVIIPAIEEEVNSGKNFAQLRQITQAIILATWYKKTLKDSLLGQVYADQSKVFGIDLEDKTAKEKIYQQYLDAFKKGVYNYIREDVDATTQQPVARKYFSGGYSLKLADQALLSRIEVVSGNPNLLSQLAQEGYVEIMARGEVPGLIAKTVVRMQEPEEPSDWQELITAAPIEPGRSEIPSLVGATDRALLPQVDAATQNLNRLDPKRLDGRTLEDGSTIRIFRDLSDYPDTAKVRDRWDRHYTVIEIDNAKLNYTAYIAIHRLTKISSKSSVLDGQYRATGGTRVISSQPFQPIYYPSKEDAMADAMELGAEMSYKNAGVELPIGGLKVAIRVNFDPRIKGNSEKSQVLISYAKALDYLNEEFGGGVLTGQDMNLHLEDAELLAKYAPETIVPYVALDLSKPPTPPTAVGVVAAMEAVVAHLYPDSPSLKDKVVTLQGLGGVGKEELLILLQKGTIVIASDAPGFDLATLLSDNPVLQDYINEGRLFLFLEEQNPDNSFTKHIFDPLSRFPELKAKMGIDHIDGFSGSAKGEVLDDVTIALLQQAGVKFTVGSANNILVDKKRHSQMLKDAGIIHIPDYIANAGGTTVVNGNLGHDISNEAVAKRVGGNTREILRQAIALNVTPQEIADEKSRAFFEALPRAPLPGEDVTAFAAADSVTQDLNRQDPKRLDGLAFEDGSTVHVLRDLADYPTDPDLISHWDKHFAVFEIRNPQLGYTAYMAVHRLTQITSKSPILNGQWRATGGTRILHYNGGEKEALANSLELSQEMSFKNAGVGLAIGGSKCTIHVNIDPTANGVDQDQRRKILISYAKAIEFIGQQLGGGVLTGQDMNITVDDAKLLYQFASTSVVPYVALELSKAPTPPTAVGVIAAMKTAISFAFSENPTLKDKVVAVQGLGGVGSLLLEPLLKAGAIVIASDVRPNTVRAIAESMRSYINTNQLFVFSEDGTQETGYTSYIVNPLAKFPELKAKMGIDHVDVFAPSAAGEVLNDETIPQLKEAGVKVVAGSANNATKNKLRHTTLMRRLDILYVPDYVANAGGVTAVDGHLGHDISDESIEIRISHHVRTIIEKAKSENRTTQDVADEASRAFFERLIRAPLPAEAIKNQPTDLALLAADAPYLIDQPGDWDKIAAAYKADPSKFWLDRALEELEWFKKPTVGIKESVDGQGHFSFTYFEDGELNASYEILDRQVKRGMGDAPAYTWIGDPADDQGNAAEVKTITYKELLAKVEKLANALTEMGVKTGDGITLYTAGNTIEAKVVRFAAMRIGAIFTPVFPGLSPQELSDRAHQINTKVVFTVDGAYRKGELSKYKEEEVDKAFEEYIPKATAEEFLKKAIATTGATGSLADEILASTVDQIKGMITIHFSELAKILDKELKAKDVEQSDREAAGRSIQEQTLHMPSRINNIVVIERAGRQRSHVHMKSGRDLYFNDVIEKMEKEGKTTFKPVSLPSEQPLFLIFTSGSTGKPKGAYHTTGGYLTNISYSMKFAWGVKPGERIFVAADDGWITGNSAMSDAPLLNGMHSFLYEGLPNWPTADRLWKILSENKINYYKTGVTAVRDFSKADSKLITKWDLSALKKSASCAEPLYAYVQAFWTSVILGGNEDAFANFFWRTEDGMFSPFIPHPLGKPQKDDASTVASPWAESKVLVLEKDEDGKIINFREARPGEVGSAFIRHFPSMIRGLWNDEDRFRDTYWPEAVVINGERWHKVGDAAKMDDEGYITFLGRDDEVINVSGHRMGTQEIESIVGRIDEVKMSAVVGIPHLLKGETPVAFVILQPGVTPSLELDTKIRKAVEENKGKIARPEEIFYVTELPQTLSNKVLRRFLETIAALPRGQLAEIYQKLQDSAIRMSVLDKGRPDHVKVLTELFGEKLASTTQTLKEGVGGTAALVAAVEGIVEKREIGKLKERSIQIGDPYDIDFNMFMPREAQTVINSLLTESGYTTSEEISAAKRHYEIIRKNGEENRDQWQALVDDAEKAYTDFKSISEIRQKAIQHLISEGLLWPLDKAFLPGEKLPKYMFAWAIVKDQWGRPVYGQPKDVLYEIIAPTPQANPNEVVGYTLWFGITRNIIAAGEDAVVGGFNFHEGDYHISGSDGVFVAAEIGSQVEEAGITRIGELFNSYSGEADLLDYRMGYDPMATINFKIKGYQTPTGTMAQFTKFGGPQVMRKPDILTLEEAGAYNLDLGTVYKSIVARAGVSLGDVVYVEGAAGGTGHLAVEVAKMQGATVTGLVSSQDRADFAKEHGADQTIIRKDPRFSALWQAVPDPVKEPEKYAEWAKAADAFREEFKNKNNGRLADMVNASVGRPTFPANVEVLADGGKLVYYGADQGFGLTFRGKPGTRSANDAFKKNRLQPGEGVLVYYGASTDGQDADLDQIGVEAIESALKYKARVAILTNTVKQQIYLQKRFGSQLVGIESVESLKSNPSFELPEEMPDLDIRDATGKMTVDIDKRYYFQEHTLKILGSAIGRFFKTPDNPSGFPDVIVERADQNTLGISGWMVRPITGRIVYLEDTENKRYRFYAPDVWFSQKTIDFPTFSILGTHLFNSFQANVVGRKLDTEQLTMATPNTFGWTDAQEAVQSLYDGLVTGTNAVRVSAPAVAGIKTEGELYRLWKTETHNFGTVKVRYFEAEPGKTIAQVTMEGPNLNALNTAMVDSLTQAIDGVAQNPSVQVVILTGGGNKSFIAGADIKELQLIIDRTEGTELAEKAQKLYARLESMNVPVVSAVNGFALGGGTELAMSTHYRIASEKAEMGQPEINLNLMPGFGGTQRLPRLLYRMNGDQGVIEAIRMILNGRRISAAKAKELGLVEEIAGTDALSRAMELAIEYARTKRGTLADAMKRRHQEILDWDKPAEDVAGEVKKLVDESPEIQAILDQSRRMGREESVNRALEAIYLGLSHGINAGLKEEAKAFGDLIVSPAGRMGIENFLMKLSMPLPLHGLIEATPDVTPLSEEHLEEILRKKGPIDPKQWEGKVVIVTGGGTGLGKDIVFRFAKAGANVVINGRRTDKLVETAREVKEATGKDIVYVQGDVVEMQDLEKLFQAAVEQFGRVDVVVNNAGVSGDVKLLPMIPAKRFIQDAMIHLHVMKTTTLFRRLMNQKAEEGQREPGTIVNIATYFTTPSRYDIRPYFFRTPYTMAQAMKIAWTKLIAFVKGESDIASVAINPGPFEGQRIIEVVYPMGAMIRNIIGIDTTGDRIQEATRGLHPKGRFVLSREVANNVMLVTSRELRDSFNGEVLSMGGIDYAVPPTVIVPTELGAKPDLTDKTIAITGIEEAHSQLASLAKGLASAGAKVVIATKNAGSLRNNFGEYSSRIILKEADVTQENSVAQFFEQLGPVDHLFHVSGSPDVSKSISREELDIESIDDLILKFAMVPTAHIAKYGSAAMIYQGIKKSGILDSRVGDFASFIDFMERSLIKERFSDREKGKLEETILGLYRGEDLEKFTSLIQRYLSENVFDAWTDEERNFAVEEIKNLLRDITSDIEMNVLLRLRDGIGRVWTNEERNIFQSGLRNSVGQITAVSADYSPQAGKDVLQRYRADVFREGIKAAFTTLAGEMAAAKSHIRVNVILPGSIANGQGDPERLNRMAIYLAGNNKSTTGLIFAPDERNAAADWQPADMPPPVSQDTVDLKTRTTVITGGAVNMGRSIAMKLAQAGSSVLIAARNKTTLQNTVTDIQAAKGTASFVEADLNNTDQIKNLADAAVALARDSKMALDLINNSGVAGVFARSDQIPLADVDPATQKFGWNTTMQINFDGALELMARLIPEIRKQGGGTIQNIITEYVFLPYILRSIYVGPKAAFGAFSLALGQKLKDEGIFISNINPSLIEGPRMDLVLRNNINTLITEGALNSDMIALMERDIETLSQTNAAVRDIIKTLEAKSETDIPRNVLKPIAWFWTQIGKSEADILSQRDAWGDKLTLITLYFKQILPLTPPSNDDVGDKAVAIARSPQDHAALDHFVSGLGEGARQGPPIEELNPADVDIRGAFSEKTALIAAVNVDEDTASKMSSLIESYLKAGAKTVVIATQKPAADVMAKFAGNDRVEFGTLDFAQENDVKDIFAKHSFDAAIYLVTNPSSSESFTDIYFDKTLSDLNSGAFEGRIVENRQKRQLFEQRHLTGPVVLLREATKSMKADGKILFVAPGQPTIEGTTALQMFAELAFVRNMERTILDKGIKAGVYQSSGEWNDALADVLVERSLPDAENTEVNLSRKTDLAMLATYEELPEALHTMIYEARKHAIDTDTPVYRIHVYGHGDKEFNQDVLTEEASSAVLEWLKEMLDVEHYRYKLTNGNELGSPYSGNDLIIDLEDPLLVAKSDNEDSQPPMVGAAKAALRSETDLALLAKELAQDVVGDIRFQNILEAQGHSLDAASKTKIIAVLTELFENPFFGEDEDVIILPRPLTEIEGASDLSDIGINVLAQIVLHRLTESGSTPVGGIDMSKAGLNLQIKRDQNGIPLPVNMQLIDQINLQGLLPVIIQIVPVVNLPLLLGLKDMPAEKKTSKDKVTSPDLSPAAYLKQDNNTDLVLSEY